MDSTIDTCCPECGADFCCPRELAGDVATCRPCGAAFKIERTGEPSSDGKPGWVARIVNRFMGVT